jgi:type III secretion system YscQ/HrcQ family protein
MAHLCNVLASRAALAGKDGPSCPLSFHFAPEASRKTAAANLDFEAGGFVWRLQFFHLDFLCDTHKALTGIEIQRLPEDLRQALFLLFLQPYLECLEKALGVPIHIQRTQSAQGKTHAAAGEAAPPFFFTLALAPKHTEDKTVRRLPLRLGIPSSEGAFWLAEKVAAACPQIRKHPGRADWRLPVTLETGRMCVPIGLLEDLALADILLPPFYPAREGKLMLRLPGGTGFCLDVSDGRAVVTDFHNKETPVVAPDPTETRAALAALEVTIHFELEKKLLPLAEIEALAPGRTFSLGTDPMSAVTITLEGQALATGRLVDLGGILGVQITRLLRQPEAKPEAS